MRATCAALPFAASFVVASALVACERDAPAPRAADARGPESAYGAYGRYPPPPDAPPAAFPTASPTSLPPPSAGCGKPAARTGVLAGQKVRVGAADRSYILSVPETYDARVPYPVVFVLHGGGGNAQGARAQMDLERHAGGKAIFVYPEARDGNWDLDSEAARNPDVALFDALLFSLGNAACVDMKRVFLTGFSNGAYMANQLACRRGDRVRAVVTHAGGGPYENQGRYDDEGHLLCAGKAVAAMVVHGDRDGTVATTEGDASLAHWRFANRCNGGTGKAVPAPCQAALGCAQPVVSCRISGLGHSVWAEGKAATWAFFDALR